MIANTLIRNFQKRTPLRTGSLVVTIFGDCIAPRGSVVWLGSLINLLAPLGISQRLVRTAVFRLVQDGILVNEQVGRRSFYSLSTVGRRSFSEATSRIYAQAVFEWDGLWTFIVASQLNAEEKTDLRKLLEPLGFRSIGSDLLALPNGTPPLLDEQLKRLTYGAKLLQMKAHPAKEAVNNDLIGFTRAAWNLEPLEVAYKEFLQLFQPILIKLERSKQLQDEDAFYLRTFLIHEYRKVLLRDPALPSALLPPSWKGHTAYQLAKTLYQLTLERSEAFIDVSLQNLVGPLPSADKTFLARFGGLR